MSALVHIRSSNGPTFLVKQSLISKSEKIKDLIKEFGPVSAGKYPEIYIPLTAQILQDVLAWMFQHQNDTESAERRDGRGNETAVEDPWDKEFLSEVIEGNILDLFWAAEYLVIPELADLTANAASAIIDEKTTEEIRQIFKLKNDFKKEEEATVQQENQWFEDH